MKDKTAQGEILYLQLMNNESGKIEIRPTKDGSTTLYSGKFSQHYHNPNGAAAESRYVFFESAEVKELLQNRDMLTIFEMGFGTGMNLILMLDYLKKTGSRCAVNFISVEAYPITADVAMKLDFGEDLNQLNPNLLLSHVFSNLKSGLNTFTISDQLTLYLFNGFFHDFENEAMGRKTDIFFHDPFSPEVNQELWTKEVFEKLLSIAADDALLATYCAASLARAAMVAAGWHVARAPGALGKREMTIASPDALQLSQFKRVNEERLKKRYEAGDFSR